MKLRYYLIILFLLSFLQNDADSRVILDKKMFYAELNGKIDLKFGYAFNQSSFKNKSKDKLSSYSNLNLLYLQHIYQNTQVGFNIKAEVSDIITLDKDKLKIEEGYFIIKNQGLGSLKYGEMRLVSQIMLINTSKVYTAAGGVNSDWVNYANLHSDYNSEVDYKLENRPEKCYGISYDQDRTFWVKPNIYSSYLVGLRQPVISYISPEIYNFQFAFSYVTGKNNLYYSDLIGAGLSYKKSLSDDINFTAAVTSEFASTDENNCVYNCNNRLRHWNFGLHLKYFNLNYIFSYGGKSGQRWEYKINNTYYMNTGIAYHSDSRKLSLTYFTSGKDITGKGTNALSSYAVSLEYPLALGTSYYFDGIKFNTKEPGLQGNNSGYILLAGLKLDF